MKYCYSKRSNASICADAVLSGEATALAEPEDLDLAAVVERLTGQMLHDDAIRYLAHALPKRNAVWWGCLCVWQAYRTGQSPKEKAALQAVITWLQEPDEGRRALRLLAVEIFHRQHAKTLELIGIPVPERM